MLILWSILSFKKLLKWIEFEESFHFYTYIGISTTKFITFTKFYEK
jgi:hypothetical protein